MLAQSEQGPTLLPNLSSYGFNSEAGLDLLNIFPMANRRALCPTAFSLNATACKGSTYPLSVLFFEFLLVRGGLGSDQVNLLKL